MGKRSDFERVERDFYPTPREAVLPLIPHLPDRFFKFDEPCAGNFALARHLSSLSNGWCQWAGDIEPMSPWVVKANALEWRYTAELIITNPPWDRKILHPMIEHFSDQAQTWLLFDADWLHTKQSVPFLPRLRKVVSVGRVKWIPDSKMTGKDNCCWYLFDKPRDNNVIEFHGRMA